MKTIPEINTEVIRIDGGYTVGRIGNVIELDEARGRVRVAWNNEPRTWVGIKSIELTATPYEIIQGYDDKKTGRWVQQRYIRK